MHTKRASSSGNIANAVVATLPRDSSSGFRYQSLVDNSPMNVPKTKQRSKPPVRSHSSTNAELSYHLQQLKNLSKLKSTISGDARYNADDRIRLTMSNLKVECDENGTGTSIHTTVQAETIETSFELPTAWKPAMQQLTIQRDAWDHKVEFLLAVIGYAVDLGTMHFCVSWQVTMTIVFSRERVAFSNRRLHERRRGILHSVLHSSHLRRTTFILVRRRSLLWTRHRIRSCFSAWNSLSVNTTAPVSLPSGRT